MKFSIVLLFCVIAVAVAAPQQADEHDAQILRQEVDNNGVDKYNFAYDTSNGISRQEAGELKTTEDGSAIVMHGSTSWTAPDGKKYEISFVADEFGYHPTFKQVA
ncbi:endocuticle structural protein SgAbd-6-like [Musca domestica]|uniref:Endocuticle structural protein SgAbd-6 n=1 Tax=Musca domestica TaxID=7370 RepID=A0A1I8NI84_MUSDO|nr:endocuticle structural protein SgAbd-6 [Musca domestica]XP_058975838.1 endocuticle structural protein SgAbd-6-like [Musca domestica]